MFDIGFWELVVIAIIALLVVGPERLPKLARDAGRWAGKIKRYINNTRRELEQELQLNDQKEFHQSLSDLDDLMKNAPDQDEDFQQNKEKQPRKNQDNKS